MTDILDAEEVAQMFKLDPRTIYKLAKAGKLPAKKIGGSWRFSKTALLAYVSTPSQPKKRRTSLHLVESAKGE